MKWETDPRPGEARGVEHEVNLRRRRASKIAAVLWCCGGIVGAFAQDPATVDSAVLHAGEVSTAPVEVDGRVLFVVRGAPSSPAPARAQSIRERIEAIARDPSIPTSALRTEEVPLGTLIAAGEHRILVVLDEDAELEILSRATLSRVLFDRIRSAIDDHREARRPDTLLRGAAQAGMATAIAAAVIALLLLLRRRLGAWMERQLRKRVSGIGIQQFEILQAERLWSIVQGGVSAVLAVGILVVFLGWVRIVLSEFVWTRALGTSMGAILLRPILFLVQGFIAELPDLIFVTILFLITRYALRVIRAFFDAVDRATVTLGGFEREWALPTYKILRLAVIALALVVAYPFIPGSDSGAFKGISLFLGVLLSLGSSSSISNIVAGYSLTYRRAFRNGDRIEVDGVMGDVIETRVQVTHLRTPKNEEVIIPNSLILNGKVVNYSSLARRHGLILHTTVGIGYEVPWRQVEAMLCLAAKRTAGLRADPPPFVLQQSLGDFCVVYEINAHCDDPQAMAAVYAELHRNIQDIFNEHGVQIMTPAYEGDPAEPKIVAREHWHAPPARPAGDAAAAPTPPPDPAPEA